MSIFKKKRRRIVILQMFSECDADIFIEKFTWLPDEGKFYIEFSDKYRGKKDWILMTPEELIRLGILNIEKLVTYTKVDL